MIEIVVLYHRTENKIYSIPVRVFCLEDTFNTFGLTMRLARGGSKRDQGDHGPPVTVLDPLLHPQ